MLKKSAIRRITMASVALLILGILYFFPTKEDIELKTNIEYINGSTSPIYLLNNDGYVIRTTLVMDTTDSLEKTKILIDTLIIGNEANKDIPSDFSPVIPQNTKVLNISLENNILKINFSKDFLNVTKQIEEKLIETLIYTLTEDKNIKGIMIFVEDVKLEELPQSNIKLPNILTRDFGINKVYDITSLKDTNKTTIYYIGKTNDLNYYIPITKITNDKNDKIEIIISELKSSPIYETNLISYLASNVELLGYESLENQINLSFNNAIFEDFNEKNLKEEVKYSISLSVKDTMNVEQVNFLIDDEIIKT